jgi:hypothetical protein
MPTPSRPSAVKTFGRKNIVFVPTLSSTTAPPLTSVNGASALDITNIVFSDGAPTVTKSTNSVDQNRRYGDTTTAQFIGTTTYGGGDMTYQYAPQAVAATAGKKAYEKFLNAPGTVTGYFVERKGIDASTDFAVGDFVNVYPVEIGPSLPVDEGDGESAEAAMTATFVVTAAPSLGVQLV